MKNKLRILVIPSWYPPDGGFFFREHSESSTGNLARHWSKEPCLFECGLDLDRKESYLTVEESIENNFWKEDDVPPDKTPE